MDITIKESINNIRDTKKKSSFAKFNIVEQLSSTNNLYDTYIIEKDEKIYKMNLFRFGEKANLDIFEKLNNIKNVNHLVESGQEGDRHYLLWEVLDYPNLGEVEVPIDEFLRKISTILSNLHKKKIYHLNVNLENIKVKSTNPLEIIIDDFASASITDAEASKKLTNVKGIDSFQSPELSLGIASSKSDYWSLGIILYYLLTKTLPEKNTYTKEIIITNIPAKFKNLVKGLLSIDLNKRYGKEEIDIVLGGGKVEENVKTGSNSFTYEDVTFNSLEDFAMFLNSQKNGLTVFKKLLYRGYFDKYYSKIKLDSLKDNLSKLNAFFYRYGQEGQQALFEEMSIYNPFLWFNKNELNRMNFKNHSTEDFSKIKKLYNDNSNVEKLTKDFKKVSSLIDFTTLKPSKKLFETLKKVALFKVDYYVVETEEGTSKIYGVNYTFFKQLILIDSKLNFLRLALPYDELINIPRNDLATYIEYKYIYRNFQIKGYSKSINLYTQIPKYITELKYYYSYNNNSAYKLYSEYNLFQSIQESKERLLATEYYLKKSYDNNLIKEIHTLETSEEFFSYFNYIFTKHVNMEINSLQLNDIDRCVILLSEVYSTKCNLKNIQDNFSLKDLKKLYKFIHKKKKVISYLQKTFRETFVDYNSNAYENSREIDSKILNFDYTIVDDKNITFKNFIISLEKFISTNKFKYVLKDYSITNVLYEEDLPIEESSNTGVFILILFIIMMAYELSKN